MGKLDTIKRISYQNSGFREVREFSSAAKNNMIRQEYQQLKDKGYGFDRDGKLVQGLILSLNFKKY